MPAQIYLITPPQPGPGFAALLAATLAAAPVGAVLIRRDGAGPSAYQQRTEALVPVIQQAGAAALVEDDLALALRADGVHLTGLAGLPEAAAALKPRQIVGIGGLRTRHDAMLAGEAGIDYLFFGALDGRAAGPETAGFAAWWVDTFQVPAVWFPGDAGPGPDDPEAEFLALGGSLWQAPEGPAAALAALSAALSTAPARGAA